MCNRYNLKTEERKKGLKKKIKLYFHIVEKWSFFRAVFSVCSFSPFGFNKKSDANVHQTWLLKKKHSGE